MNLGEQLSELRVNILRDTSDLIEGNTDRLWSDETLLRYIGDAEKRFARQSLILRDATTPEVTQVKLKTGGRIYPLHRSVLSVISASYVSATGHRYDLMRSGHALIAQAEPNENLTFDPAFYWSTQLPPGQPRAYFTDESLVFARSSRITFSVYPPPDTPEDGMTVHLRVIRMPLCGYDSGCLEHESELVDYELDVLEWAAYRAQRTFDGDAGAPTSAAAHKAAFDAAVADAKREAKRKMFANTGIKYGANGFAWTR
jgi:hypothetical protein